MFMLRCIKHIRGGPQYCHHVSMQRHTKKNSCRNDIQNRRKRRAAGGQRVESQTCPTESCQTHQFAEGGDANAPSRVAALRASRRNAAVCGGLGADRASPFAKCRHNAGNRRKHVRGRSRYAELGRVVALVGSHALTMRLHSKHAEIDDEDATKRLLRTVVSNASPHPLLTERLLQLMACVRAKPAVIHIVPQLCGDSRSEVRLVVRALRELLSESADYLVPVLGALSDLVLPHKLREETFTLSCRALRVVAQEDYPSVVRTLLATAAASGSGAKATLRVVHAIRAHAATLSAHTAVLLLQVVAGTGHRRAGLPVIKLFLRAMSQAEKLITFDWLVLLRLLGRPRSRATASRWLSKFIRSRALPVDVARTAMADGGFRTVFNEPDFAAPLLAFCELLLDGISGRGAGRVGPGTTASIAEQATLEWVIFCVPTFFREVRPLRRPLMRLLLCLCSLPSFTALMRTDLKALATGRAKGPPSELHSHCLYDRKAQGHDLFACGNGKRSSGAGSKCVADDRESGDCGSNSAAADARFWSQLSRGETVAMLVQIIALDSPREAAKLSHFLVEVLDHHETLEPEVLRHVSAALALAGAAQPSLLERVLLFIQKNACSPVASEQRAGVVVGCELLRRGALPPKDASAVLGWALRLLPQMQRRVRRGAGCDEWAAVGTAILELLCFSSHQFGMDVVEEVWTLLLLIFLVLGGSEARGTNGDREYE